MYWETAAGKTRSVFLQTFAGSFYAFGQTHSGFYITLAFSMAILYNAQS